MDTPLSAHPPLNLLHRSGSTLNEATKTRLEYDFGRPVSCLVSLKTQLPAVWSWASVFAGFYGSSTFSICRLVAAVPWVEAPAMPGPDMFVPRQVTRL